MSNFAALLDVLGNNQKDVEEIIGKFGIGNLIRVAPNLIHIMQTLAKHKDPVQAAEKVQEVLAYSEETKEKVTAFQKAYKLDADGLVGNETWGKVEELLHNKGGLE